jgi:hypothetical protein
MTCGIGTISREGSFQLTSLRQGRQLFGIELKANRFNAFRRSGSMYFAFRILNSAGRINEICTKKFDFDAFLFAHLLSKVEKVLQ